MMNKRVKQILSVFLGAGMLFGCSQASEDSSQANWKDWPEEITVVQYTNEENENTPAMHDEFRQHLENELGIKVEEFTGSGTYATAIEGMAAEEIDVLLVSPQSFSQAKEKAGAELFATIDSDTDYYSSFITQADNEDINNLDDLKGKNFAFADPSSSSGYLYPKATLIKDLSLDNDKLEQSGYFFENVVFSGSHDNSIIGVSMGDYDAAAVASTVLKRLIDAGGVDEKSIKEVARSVDIPNAAYAVRGNLPDDLKQAIQEAFLSFDDGKYFEALYGKPETRFTAIDDSYYDEAVEAMRIAGGEE